MDYKLAIRQLAVYKHNLGLTRTAMTEMEAAVTSSPRYLACKEQAAIVKENVAELDAAIRDQAVREMADNEIKPDHSAVKVLHATDYTILDGTTAFDWCLKNLPGVLRIDETLLIKYMREFVTDANLPPFVRVAHGYRATISPDLSKYLEPEETHAETEPTL